MLLLPEEETDESWGPSNKQRSFRKRESLERKVFSKQNK
jgi:hypothetical protein